MAILVLPAIQMAQLVHAGERAGEVGLHHFACASVRAGYHTKIYSAITEPTQSHPERALYKQTYVNTMMALLPALMKVAPQVSATVAHETLVLGPGFTFAIDIDGFGRAITFEQHGSSWRVAADKEPDFVIEFRDLDYAFDVFSGAISLKEALAARLFATHGANSKGVAITYLFDTVLHTFFCWRSAYRR